MIVSAAIWSFFSLHLKRQVIDWTAFNKWSNTGRSSFWWSAGDKLYCCHLSEDMWGKDSAWIVLYLLCYKVELKCNINATTTTNGLHKRCTTLKNDPGESHKLISCSSDWSQWYIRWLKDYIHLTQYLFLQVFLTFIIIYLFLIVACNVWVPVHLTARRSQVWFPGPGPLCVAFGCSPCVCMSSRQVLWPPFTVQSHARELN